MTGSVAVVGGGAAGLMAALAAARGLGPGRVAVYERGPRVGKKLAATGNGRCNLTNLGARPDHYLGSAADAVAAALDRFPPGAVLRVFDEIGVTAAVELGGRVYPMSGQASSVVDALRLALAERGVAEVVDFDVASVRRAGGAFSLRGRDGREARADRVILACGSPAAPGLGGSDAGLALAKSLGHAVRPPLPALCPLRTDEAPIRALKGIRVDGRATLYIGGRAAASASGEVLFAEYGLSGPAIFDLSRPAAAALAEGAAAQVALAILPGGEDAVRSLLRARRAALSGRALENFLTGMVNKRLGQVLVKLAADGEAGALARPASSLTDWQLSTLARLLTGWRLAVEGTRGFEAAQVAAGGVIGGELDPATLQSRAMPGLYLAGEMIDVDAGCGGYNLQWAWASGLLAGGACAASLAGDGRGGDGA
ncbi:MAG: aminoacetone oxidase family FAD-binding enzyme [Clostridiales bacterium]|nr:aminoacetone oxidase family FAD-binding enzyme [Clostridiales bacterium]